MLRASMSKNSLLLGAFALATAAILAATQAGTESRIAAAEREAAQKALLEIVPLERHNNDLLMDTQPIDPKYWPMLGLKQGGDINIARQDGQPVAAIVPAVAPDGYSGDIKLIVGINADGTLAGVRTLAHNETPGLGDKIELKKASWMLSFDDKSLTNPGLEGWEVKKDGGVFDQFTGATITPRAVVHQVRRALQFFAEADPLSLQTETPTATATSE